MNRFHSEWEIREELWLNYEFLNYNALRLVHLSLQLSWIPFFLTQKYMFEFCLTGEWTHIPKTFLWWLWREVSANISFVTKNFQEFRIFFPPKPQIVLVWSTEGGCFRYHEDSVRKGLSRVKCAFNLFFWGFLRYCSKNENPRRALWSCVSRLHCFTGLRPAACNKHRGNFISRSFHGWETPKCCEDEIFVDRKLCPWLCLKEAHF